MIGMVTVTRAAGKECGGAESHDGCSLGLLASPDFDPYTGDSASRAMSSGWPSSVFRGRPEAGLENRHDRSIDRAQRAARGFEPRVGVAYGGPGTDRATRGACGRRHAR